MELSDVGEHVFAAQCILSSRVNQGRVEYLIKWKGWGKKYNTWEPEKNILDKRLIKEFKESKAGKRGKNKLAKPVAKKNVTTAKRGRPFAKKTKPPGQRSLESTPTKRKLSSPATSPQSSPSRKKNVSTTPNKVLMKVRRKYGPKGMSRLLVRPIAVSTGGARNTKTVHRKSTEMSESLDNNDNDAREVSGEVLPTAVGVLSGVRGQVIPGLRSPVWQPASKRILDSVCVTDITTCSGVTVTVRESSVIDGFFRSRPSDIDI